MPYVINLNDVNESDLSKIGYRALDFAKIFQAKYNIPLSFIITNAVCEEFLLQTKLGINIRTILNNVSYDDESLQNAYEKIKNLFASAEFSNELSEPLKEAYESLAVGLSMNSAADLLKENEPSVNLITSPNYLTGSEDIDGVIMNMRGFDKFLTGLKSSWLSMYTPESILMRKRKEISDFSTGVIIQRFIPAESSAETYSKGPLGDYEITVRAYFGLPDVLKKSSKDAFSVSKEYLTIESSKRVRQEYKISWSDESGISKIGLGVHGSEQKLSDKEVIETARITKRINSLFGFNFKAYFLVRKNVPYCFFISRFSDEPEKAPVSKELESLTVVQAAGISNESEVVDENNGEESNKFVENSDSEPDVGSEESNESIGFVEDSESSVDSEEFVDNVESDGSDEFVEEPIVKVDEESNEFVDNVESDGSDEFVEESSDDDSDDDFILSNGHG